MIAVLLREARPATDLPPALRRLVEFFPKPHVTSELWLREEPCKSARHPSSTEEIVDVDRKSDDGRGNDDDLIAALGGAPEILEFRAHGLSFGQAHPTGRAPGR